MADDKTPPPPPQATPNPLPSAIATTLTHSADQQGVEYRGADK